MSSNRLLNVLPPNLCTDLIVNAAKAAGLQEELSLGYIPRVEIWARIKELSEDQLDHLAWHLHLDGYSYCNSKKEKLWLVENFHDWHRYKGTIYGHRLYWRKLLNRQVYGYAPRTNSFLGASLSAEERQKFEAPHPEARVYPYRNKGLMYGLFLNHVLSPPYPVVSDAVDRVGLQVYSYDPLCDQETKLNTIKAYTDKRSIIPIALAGKATGVFLGAAGKCFSVDHGSAGRLYNITLSSPPVNELERRHSLTIQPLTPIHSYYQEERVAGIAIGVFCYNRHTDVYPTKAGSCLGGYVSAPQDGEKKVFVSQSSAADRIYKKIKLFDPARAVKTTKTVQSFLGGFRLGKLPPHQGEIAVDATGVASPWTLYTKGSYMGKGYLVKSGVEERIKQILDVGRLAARMSDKILISITNHKEITASTIHKAGGVVAGQYDLTVPQ